MIKQKKTIIKILSGTLLVLLIVLAGWRFVVLPWLITERDKQNSGKAAPNSGIPPHIELIYPANLENNNILVGASHNVFVGKVTGETGNKETQIGPRTQYSVQVIENIKGELSDIVTLDMLGGYEDGKLVAIEGFTNGDFLLQEGTTYLFATRYNADENWHTIVGHPNGKKLLTKDTGLSDTDIIAIARQDTKYKAWEKAYAEEVLINADVANNNTLNSFQSLPSEQKAAAQARADAARASLEASASAE